MFGALDLGDELADDGGVDVDDTFELLDPLQELVLVGRCRPGVTKLLTRVVRVRLVPHPLCEPVAPPLILDLVDARRIRG